MIINLKGYPSIQLDTIVEYSPSAAAEITDITVLPDVAGVLGGKYFHIFTADNTTTYTVWFNVDNGSSAPVIPYTTLLEVDISLNDSADDVASALQTALDGTSDFSAYVQTEDSTIVNVMNLANGSAQNAADPNQWSQDSPDNGTGFTFNVTTQGVTDPSLPSSLTMYLITGRRHDQTAYQQSNKFGSYAFKKYDFNIIVAERQILNIVED